MYHNQVDEKGDFHLPRAPEQKLNGTRLSIVTFTSSAFYSKLLDNLIRCILSNEATYLQVANFILYEYYLINHKNNQVKKNTLLLLYYHSDTCKDN